MEYESGVFPIPLWNQTNRRLNKVGEGNLLIRPSEPPEADLFHNLGPQFPWEASSEFQIGRSLLDFGRSLVFQGKTNPEAINQEGSFFLITFSLYQEFFQSIWVHRHHYFVKIKIGVRFHNTCKIN